MKAIDEIILNFTKQQQNEIIRTCGFNPKAINTSALSLIKFSMAASAAGSDMLPLVKNISTAQSILNRESASSNDSKPYYIVIDLTQDQREIIRDVVKKEWSRIMFFPDEYEITFTEKWAQDISVTRVGKSIVIVPEGCEYSPSPGDLPILLQYRQGETDDSFGKGTHPATQATLVLMEKYLKPGSKVLDVGTGSGILAIAAARLGASSIFAIDIVAEAVKAAEKSIEINNLNGKIQLEETTIDSIDDTYHLVLANIFPKVIISLAQEFSQKVVTGGFLIISGIVEPRMPDIVRHLESFGFKQKSYITLKTWSAVILEKIK